MESEIRQPNYAIEFMRIIGVLMITFTHIRHEFTSGTPYFFLEILPTYGTLLLSVVSGYLFGLNPGQSNLLSKKIRTLLVPYLIANLAVLIPVCIIYQFGYNYLNRLPYDSTLITQGLLALNAPPINPPTYFIRDLFVIFCIISLMKKNLYSLLFLVPLAIFGSLLLRWDIAVLFSCGFLFARWRPSILWKGIISGALLGVALLAILYAPHLEYHKPMLAIMIFLLLVDLKFKFVKTGGFTYCLHLYHCPAMVFLFPILYQIWPDPVFLALSQIVLAFVCCSIMFLFIRRFHLNSIIGNR